MPGMSNNNHYADSYSRTAHKAGRKLRRFAGSAAHDAKEALANTEKQIRYHPLKASAFAAIMGFLLGTSYRRH